MNNHTDSHIFLSIVYRIEIVIFPILILVGSVCNVTTFIVMRRRRMRVSSTCIYMAALAVTDTLVLWTGCLNQWLFLIHLPTLVVTSNFTCKLLPFLFVLFADTSVWIIVCMSFERYFAVSRPLRATQMCTTRRAKWVLLVLLIVFILIDGHFLLTFELEIIGTDYPICHPKAWARHFVGKIFVYIDALKYSAVPFCVSFVLNILIIQRVFRAHDISNQLRNAHQYRLDLSYQLRPNKSLTCNSPSLLAHSNQSSSLSNARVSRRVTVMLLSVSIAFCILSAPMSLMQIAQSVADPGSHETPLAIGKAIAEICQYLNHSCAFFLYALTGRIFRREFVRLFFPTRFSSRSIPQKLPLRQDQSKNGNRCVSVYSMREPVPKVYRPFSRSFELQRIPSPIKDSFSLDRDHCQNPLIDVQHENLWRNFRQLFDGNESRKLSLMCVFRATRTKSSLV